RPNSQAALEGLATCAFAAEDYEAAERYCSKLVEYAPDNFERWFNLGVAQHKNGGLFQPAILVLRHSQIEPALEIVRRTISSAGSIWEWRNTRMAGWKRPPSHT